MKDLKDYQAQDKDELISTLEMIRRNRFEFLKLYSKVSESYLLNHEIGLEGQDKLNFVNMSDRLRDIIEHA